MTRETWIDVLWTVPHLLFLLCLAVICVWGPYNEFAYTAKEFRDRDEFVEWLDHAKAGWILPKNTPWMVCGAFGPYLEIRQYDPRPHKFWVYVVIDRFKVVQAIGPLPFYPVKGNSDE